MSIKDTARDLVVLKEVAARLAKADRETRTRALSDMDKGDRTTAKLPDGTPIGSVTVARGATHPTVTSEAELLEWVKENRPDGVETIERIKPWLRAEILNDAKVNGVIYPGVEVVEGDSYLTVRVTDTDAIAKAWAAGTLAVPGSDLATATQIESGEQ